MNDRKTNIAIAWMFFIASMLLIIGSGYFTYKASTVGSAKQHDVLAKQCVKEFEAVGIKPNIRPQDHAIVSYQPGMELMQDRVNSSSVVIGRCAGYRLVEFCAGDGCPKPGVFFVLETL